MRVYIMIFYQAYLRFFSWQTKRRWQFCHLQLQFSNIQHMIYYVSNLFTDQCLCYVDLLPIYIIPRATIIHKLFLDTLLTCHCKLHDQNNSHSSEPLNIVVQFLNENETISVVLPTIMYGCKIWSPFRESELCKHELLKMLLNKQGIGLLISDIRP